MFLNDSRDLGYRDFYPALFEYAKARPTTVLGHLLATVRERLFEFANPSNDLQDPTLSEELSRMLAKYPGSFARGLPVCCWIMINEGIDRFYAELEEFLDTLRPGIIKDAVVLDLLRFQKDLMLRPEYDPDTGKAARYLVNWPRYFKDGTLAHAPVVIQFHDMAMGPAHQDALKKGSLGHFIRAAVGTHFPFSTYRRFFHQFDRMVVEPALAQSEADAGSMSGAA